MVAAKAGLFAFLGSRDVSNRAGGYLNSDLGFSNRPPVAIILSGTIAEGPPGFCHHQTSQLLLRSL